MLKFINNHNKSVEYIDKIENNVLNDLITCIHKLYVIVKVFDWLPTN